ncbi:hypothetical protein TRFO_34779 [Tritrichomonas foetus]|uniref:Protein kinase domain-containing protein n=1 Tax=Tritrichomonas foetus TaxID=1144522 RepID=A0A1J4JMV4_9EUKA|nr:hypothetical protein TRFO_34779 [Tritrichomonas foetus]|eukprot:OHS98877.1 hypothetical protein TRFO_34779 [Tritrichomonas foetus]
MEQFQVDLKNFKKEKEIGHGSYADVYGVTDRRNKQYYAAKISLEKLKEEIDKISFEREVTIFSKLKHAAFVGFVGFSPKDFRGKSHTVIITEYVPNGSLATVIEKPDSRLYKGKWNDTLKLINIYGIASGMAYLHENHIIHRDMKPENVLLDANYYPRITDFGLSKIFDANSSNYQSMNGGTCQYMAPEIITDDHYNTSVDVYAYGVLVYELYTSSFAYANLPLAQIMSRVSYGYRPTIPDSIAPAYRELIEKCWAQSSDERPTFKEVVKILETEEGFITPKVDRQQFHDYINYVKNFVKKDMTIKPVSKSKKGKFRKVTSLLPEPEKKALSSQSRDLLKQADEENNDARFSVGKNLIEGINGFPKLPEIGLQYLTKASECNHIGSLKYLGEQLYSGEKIPADQKRAKSLLFEAASLGDHTAMLQLGLILQKQEPPDYIGASRLFKRAADLGNGEAMLNYGFLCKNGQGVPQSIEETTRYYKMSCDAGFPRGINAYGVALESGWVGEPNDHEAAKYYKLSADANCAAGMRNYAFMLLDGRGVPRDDKKAAHYFHKAAQQDDEDALINYGYMLQNGRGVETDKKKAASYYKKAAKLGNDDAMNRYGHMLMSGDGIPQDLNKAISYFKMAIELGNEEAPSNLQTAQQQIAKQSTSNSAPSSRKHHHKKK